MNKKILRNKYLEIRKNINGEDRTKYNNEIFNKIVNLDEYKENGLVLIYVSLRYEVDTLNLIKHTLDIGKRVAVPKCIGKEILFCYINSLNELEKSSFKILEPRTNNLVKGFENSICIVPGIAFDKENNRIGYGKGFYDRFLMKYTGLKIGLAYKHCICEKIDTNKFDIKMDKIITNN